MDYDLTRLAAGTDYYLQFRMHYPNSTVERMNLPLETGGRGVDPQCHDAGSTATRWSFGNASGIWA